MENVVFIQGILVPKSATYSRVVTFSNKYNKSLLRFLQLD